MLLKTCSGRKKCVMLTKDNLHFIWFWIWECSFCFRSCPVFILYVLWQMRYHLFVAWLCVAHEIWNFLTTILIKWCSFQEDLHKEIHQTAYILSLVVTGTYLRLPMYKLLRLYCHYCHHFFVSFRCLWTYIKVFLPSIEASWIMRIFKFAFVCCK